MGMTTSTPLGAGRCKQGRKAQDGSLGLRATRVSSLKAIARGSTILLCRLWTARMLKRAIWFVESIRERDGRDFNLNKAELLFVLRWLHHEMVDDRPLIRAT